MSYLNQLVGKSYKLAGVTQLQAMQAEIDAIEEDIDAAMEKLATRIHQYTFVRIERSFASVVTHAVSRIERSFASVVTHAVSMIPSQLCDSRNQRRLWQKRGVLLGALVHEQYDPKAEPYPQHDHWWAWETERDGLRVALEIRLHAKEWMIENGRNVVKSEDVTISKYSNASKVDESIVISEINYVAPAISEAVAWFREAARSYMPVMQAKRGFFAAARESR